MLQEDAQACTAALPLTDFANCHVQVLMMSGVGFFLLKGVEIARHSGKTTKYALLAWRGGVRGGVRSACTLGYSPGLAHLHQAKQKKMSDPEKQVSW